VSRRKQKHDPAPSVLHEQPRAIQLMAKARALSGDVVDAAAALHQLEKQRAEWESASAEQVDYDPEALLTIVEHSAHLQPNIDGYAVNIDGYGHRAEPRVDWLVKLDTEDGREELRAAMDFERWTDAQEAAFSQAQENGGDVVAEVPPEITDEELDAKIAEIQMSMRHERFRFSAWFDHCVSDMSFVRLRRILRWDREAVGWCAIELLRDGAARLQRLRYVPAHTVRPLVDQPELVTVVEDNPVTVLSIDRQIYVQRRFPRFVQIVSGERVYFKAVGDPRVVSRNTGIAYKDLQAMQAKDAEGPEAQEAHELLFMGQHSPRTLASPPRWISGLLRALGTREADETNYHHLRNKSFTAGIMFVSGGRVNQEMRERIEDSIRAELQGAENAGKILVVEAIPHRGSPNDRAMQPSITFQSLRDAHQTDAMFTEYDARSADTIGALFRQSPLLRGYTPSNLNRATAEAALQFTENQVYGPERDDFDWIVNKYIVPEIGIHYLKFVSNTPPARTLEETTEFLKTVVPHGALLPAEIREIAGKVLNRELTPIDEPWASWPMPMTLAGIPAGGMPQGEAGMVSQRLGGLEERVAQIANQEFRDAGLNLEANVHTLSAEEWEQLQQVVDEQRGQK